MARRQRVEGSWSRPHVRPISGYRVLVYRDVAALATDAPWEAVKAHRATVLAATADVYAERTTRRAAENAMFKARDQYPGCQVDLVEVRSADCDMPGAVRR